jgi:hypothetical protein
MGDLGGSGRVDDVSRWWKTVYGGVWYCEEVMGAARSVYVVWERARGWVDGRCVEFPRGLG